MADLVYYSCALDTARGQIDFDTDTFYLMLVTAAYVPNANTNTKRSDVTNEIPAGGGYATGGAAIAVASVVRAGAVTSVTFGNVLWDPSTISAARAGVVYKHRGGLPAADELVGYLDFGGPISSVNGPFLVTPTAPLQMTVA